MFVSMYVIQQYQIYHYIQGVPKKVCTPNVCPYLTTQLVYRVTCATAPNKQAIDWHKYAKFEKETSCALIIPFVHKLHCTWLGFTQDLFTKIYWLTKTFEIINIQSNTQFYSIDNFSSAICSVSVYLSMYIVYVFCVHVMCSVVFICIYLSLGSSTRTHLYWSLGDPENELLFILYCIAFQLFWQ